MSDKAQQIEFLLAQVRADGVALTGGTATFYEAGTTTLKTVYLDRNKATAASNPYTLDANATAQLYGDGLYKVVIKNSAGVTKYTRDNLSFGSGTGNTQVITPYSSLTAAVADIGSTPTDLYISQDTTCTANTTVPSTLNLIFGAGADVNQGAYTLTINGGITAPLAQIFSGTGPIIFGVGAIREVYPEWWGNDAAAFRAAVAAVAASNNGSTTYPVLSLGAKIYTVSGVSHGAGLFYKGKGSGQTRIIHADGIAEPLITITGATGYPNAHSYYGFEGITFVGGSQTTALIYYQGNVDNQVKFHDLGFAASNSPATCDGISMADYVNFHGERIRFDGIGSYAIRVRAASAFYKVMFSLNNWTWDNEKAGATEWGDGIFYMDATGLSSALHKGIVRFTNGNIETHKPLSSTKPAKAWFRVLQNTTFADTIGAQVVLDFDNIAAFTLTTSIAFKDMKAVSVNYRDIAISARNFHTQFINEFYNNDAGNAKNIMHSPPAATFVNYNATPDDQRYQEPFSYRVNKLFGINILSYSGDAAIAAGYFAKGDFAYSVAPTNTSGQTGRVFAYKSVQNRVGLCVPSPATLAVTGSIESGTALLTLSGTVPDATVFPGVALDIAGAGAASGTLSAMVISIDYTSKVLTLDTNAGTTVTGAAITQGQALMAVADMVFYGTAAPTTGSYRAGDKVINTAAIGAYGGVSEWRCIATGTPGTWRPTKWVVGKNATANRPTLTASDIGVMYLDTTLDADGKPIWWNGVAWVDATGATV